MIFVKDLKKDIFNSKFLELLPEYCDICGSPNQVIESLNSLECSNPHCPSKASYRLYSLLKGLGDTTFSVEECRKILENFESSNPYVIFLYNPTDDGEIYNGYGLKKSFEFYNKLNYRRGMLLWEYIKIGTLGYLNYSAEKIFRNYTDLDVFYSELINGGISFIQKLLLEDTKFANDNSICVDAVLIYEELIQIKDDLLEGFDGVVIIEPEIKFSILFANDCDGYNSNKDFLFEVNKKFNNKIYFYQVYSLSPTVDFVFWDDRGLNEINSTVKEALENYKNIKIVDTENIYKKVLAVLQI